MHAVAEPASSLHVAVVVVASAVENASETELPVVEPLTGEVMVVTGAIESTVKLTVAEAEPDALATFT